MQRVHDSFVEELGGDFEGANFGGVGQAVSEQEDESDPGVRFQQDVEEHAHLGAAGQVMPVMLHIIASVLTQLLLAQICH